MNYQEIKAMSSKELKDYLKQGFADVETEDMISYELYEVCLLYTSPSPRDRG